MTHNSHVHQHEGICTGPLAAVPVPTRSGLAAPAGREGATFGIPPPAAGDLAVRAGWHSHGTSLGQRMAPLCGHPCLQVGVGGPHRRVGSSRGAPWGALLCLPCREACCVCPHAGGHGAPHSQVLAPTRNTFPRGCIFWGAVGPPVPRARAAGHITRLLLRSLPCTSHVWGLGGCKDGGSSCIYGFGHGMACPCSVCGCWGRESNRQGQGLPGSTPASP